jgi:hypothetical protein
VTSTAAWARRAAVAFVLAWFVYFANDGLFATFAPDDMMNLHGYWQPGPWRAIESQFMLGSNTYRPMGAVFYLPLYTLFGLNPLPYRVVIFAVMLLNVWLAFRFARALGLTEIAAGLVCLLVSYHAKLGDLNYTTSVVYDVLCFTFYCATFVYYSRARRRGARFRARQWAVFLGLYLCALNSKEMAVSLPLMLLAYEVFYQSERRWAPAFVAGFMTAVFIAGKIVGADPLMAQPAYKPVLTLERWITSSRLELNELFYAGNYFTARRLMILMLILTAVAILSRCPKIRFAVVMIWIVPLPIVFLVGRVHSCLYLPLLAWSLLVAQLISSLAAWAGRARSELRWAVLAVGIILLARITIVRKRAAMPDLRANGQLTARVIGMFNTLHPKLKPHSQILLVNDPFQDWDAKFIAELWIGDRTVTAHLQNKTPYSEGEVHREMHYVFRFEGDRIVPETP